MILQLVIFCMQVPTQPPYHMVTVDWGGIQPSLFVRVLCLGAERYNVPQGDMGAYFSLRPPVGHYSLRPTGPEGPPPSLSTPTFGIDNIILRSILSAMLSVGGGCT